MKKIITLVLLNYLIISSAFSVSFTFQNQQSKSKNDPSNLRDYTAEELEIIHNYIDEMVLVDDYTFEGKACAFKIGKFEVTQELYKAVMGINPSYYCKNPVEGEDQAKRPVEFVSWYDAVYFCNVLTTIVMGKNQCCYTITDIVTETDDMEAQKNKVFKDDPTYVTYIKSANVTINHKKKGFRLPTMDEWLYAARGGNKSNGYKYSGSNNLEEVGWVLSNSNRTTHQVGLLKANELGLYDMTGNVKEFCEDLRHYTNTKNEVFPRRISIGGNMFSKEDESSVNFYDEKLEAPGNGGQGFRIVAQNK